MIPTQTGVSLLILSICTSLFAEQLNFSDLDINHDQHLSTQELQPLDHDAFDHADANGDRQLTEREFKGYHHFKKGILEDLVLIPAGTQIIRDIEYIENGHRRNKLDIYYPANYNDTEKLPLIVYIHGGAWLKWSKQRVGLQTFLVEHGFAVASISYQLATQANYPRQIHECKAAIRFLRKNADKYGFDPERFGVWGLSAGGQLAGLVGTGNDVTELEGELGVTGVSSRVQAACTWFAPTDFVKMHLPYHQIPTRIKDPREYPISRLLGGLISEKPTLTRLAGSINFVSEDDPPFLLMHGAIDPLVPPTQSTEMHARLQSAGVDTTLILVEGVKHARFTEAEHLNTVAEFFKKHLNKPTTKQPNVVLIYGDDVGYGDIGANGSELIPTPNIDRLAAEGLNFRDGHSSSTTCTPSRFSLLTGIHAFRYKARILPPNAPLIVPLDQPTLATVFKQAGYATGIIGKWHLGIGKKGTPVDWNGDVKPGPLELGFDESFLIPSTNDRVPCVYLKNHRVLNLDPSDPLLVGRKLAEVQNQSSTQYPDGLTNREAMTYYESSSNHNNSVINGIGRIGYMSGGKSALWDDEAIADDLLAEAKTFIAKHKSEPFFLYFSSPDIHVPRTPHPRFQGRTKLGYRGDAMVQFDWTVGEIMKLLDAHDLTENTIVIFSSDNGPTFDNGYHDGSTVIGTTTESDHGHDASGIWSGGKNMIYEGGTRVPFIIRWPAQIKPGTSDAMVNQIDFIASFAHLLGVNLEQNAAIDSQNTWDAFLGEDPVGRQNMIEEGMDLALRTDNWKYVEKTVVKRDGKRSPLPESLFDLETDPSEAQNLIHKHPERAQAMKRELNEIVQSGRLSRN